MVAFLNDACMLSSFKQTNVPPANGSHYAQKRVKISVKTIHFNDSENYSFLKTS